MPTRAPVLSRLTAFERQAVCPWWRPLSVKLQVRIDLDEDLTMLIGPELMVGGLLEVGVVVRAVPPAERLTESLDPEVVADC